MPQVKHHVEVTSEVESATNGVRATIKVEFDLHGMTIDVNGKPFAVVDIADGNARIFPVTESGDVTVNVPPISKPL